MKKTNQIGESGSTTVIEASREYQRGYFQGFAAAKRQDIKLVKSHLYATVRMKLREGMSVEEILADMGSE